MNENKAWYRFEHTGNIRDYLVYSQCKQKDEEAQSQEEKNDDGYSGIGYNGEARG